MQLLGGLYATISWAIFATFVTIAVACFQCGFPKWGIWTAVLAWGSAGVAIGFGAHEKLLQEEARVKSENEQQLKQLEGLLVPANEPTPAMPSGEVIPPDCLALFLGNSGACVKFFPKNVLRIKGQDVLVIDKHAGQFESAFRMMISPAAISTLN